MTPATVTTDDLRAQLLNLATAAASFVRGRGLIGPRRHLSDEVDRTNQVLDAEDATGTVPADPEALVKAWLNSGGVWHELVAAVSRLGLMGYSNDQNKSPS